jgi:predicted kinase
MNPPDPPDFQVPWDDLDRTFAWIRRMRDVPQDPVHHAEGDVWTHTRMVCEAIASSSTWRALRSDARRVGWLAALLHDVAKPDCTRIDDDGRISSRGHSVRGAILARRILWEAGVDFPAREAVCAIVRQHQIPFFLVDRADARELALRASVLGDNGQLALVAEADARGRTAVDQRRLLDQVDLFRQYCEDEKCLRGVWDFPSDAARVAYFASGGSRDPSYAPHEAFSCDVIVMCGLPGSGKDRWIAANAAGWPVVSLDALREELDVDAAATGKQGEVVQAARARAREHLRAGRSFVWNATNLSRAVRGQVLRLLHDYGARVRIVYVEADADQWRAQNRAREQPVPDAVLDKLLDRWEVPDLTEAHAVDYALGGPSP